MSSSKQNKKNKENVFRIGLAGAPVKREYKERDLVVEERTEEEKDDAIIKSVLESRSDKRTGKDTEEIIRQKIDKIRNLTVKLDYSEISDTIIESFINKDEGSIIKEIEQIKKNNDSAGQSPAGIKIMSKKPEKLTINPEAKSEKIDMYDEMKEEDEKRLSNRCATEFKIDGKKEGHIKNILEKETDHKKLEFALKWFSENRNKSEIKNKAVSSGVEISDAKKVDIAIEAGALDELDTKGKYKKDKIELENIYTIRKDFSKQDGCPIESRFLALNILNKRMERKQTEMKEQGISEQEIFQNEEIENLMGDIKELSKKITGFDLDEKAEKNIGVLQTQEEYKNENLKKEKEETTQGLKQEIFKEEYEQYINNPNKFNNIVDSKLKNGVKLFKENFNLEVDDEQILALYKAGYDPKDFKKTGNWGLYKNKIELKKGEKIMKKDFENFLSEKKQDFSNDIETTAEDNLANKWINEIEPKYQKELNQEIQNQIEKIAKSPENAVKNIQTLFNRIKGRQIDEFFEKSEIRKQKKTAEKIEEIKELENEDKEKVVPDVHKTLFDIVDKREEIEEMMEGDFDLKDEDNRKKFHNYFSEEMGIDYVSDENILDFAEQENVPFFGEVIKSERGWLDYVLELIFSAFNTETE